MSFNPRVAAIIAAALISGLILWVILGKRSYLPIVNTSPSAEQKSTPGPDPSSETGRNYRNVGVTNPIDRQTLTSGQLDSDSKILVNLAAQAAVVRFDSLEKRISEKGSVPSDYLDELSNGFHCKRGGDNYSVDALIKQFVDYGLVNDTPRVRESVAVTYQLNSEFCKSIGSERQKRFKATVEENRTNSEVFAWGDMVYGIPSDIERNNRTGKADFAAARNLLLKHTNPAAVSFALQVTSTNESAARRLEFFSAGSDVGSTVERVKLLPETGLLYRCKRDPAICMPLAPLTLAICGPFFTCSTSLDMRGQLALRYSPLELSAIEAMANALITERRKHGMPN